MPTKKTNAPTRVSVTLTGLPIKVHGARTARQPDMQINAKGVGEYLKASRALWDDGGPIGPVLLCRGQAVEIALKFFLLRRGTYKSKGGHWHHRLAKLRKDCEKAPNPLALTADQVRVIKVLQLHHCGDSKLSSPSRYRSDWLRVMTTHGGQGDVEALVETILAQAKQ